jgi:hypothetical protein
MNKGFHFEWSTKLDKNMAPIYIFLTPNSDEQMNKESSS